MLDTLFTFFHVFVHDVRYASLKFEISRKLTKYVLDRDPENFG